VTAPCSLPRISNCASFSNFFHVAPSTRFSRGVALECRIMSRDRMGSAPERPPSRLITKGLSIDGGTRCRLCYVFRTCRGVEVASWLLYVYRQTSPKTREGHARGRFHHKRPRGPRGSIEQGIKLWSKGQTRAREDTLVEVVKALGVSWEYFFPSPPPKIPCGPGPRWSFRLLPRQF